MKRLTATLCLTVAVLLGSAGMSWSADFDKGLAAAQSGDYATALREWKPLAEQGNAVVQFYLGWMYNNGRGVPQDYETAVKWFTLAAEQGNASAQSNLGWMYDNGRGVSQDHKNCGEVVHTCCRTGECRCPVQSGLDVQQRARCSTGLRNCG